MNTTQYTLILSSDIIEKSVKFLKHNGNVLNSFIYVIDGNIILFNSKRIVKLKKLYWKDENNNRVDFKGTSTYAMNVLEFFELYSHNFKKGDNVTVVFKNDKMYMIGDTSREYKFYSDIINPSEVKSILEHGIGDETFLYSKKQLKNIVKDLNNLYTEPKMEKYNNELLKYTVAVKNYDHIMSLVHKPKKPTKPDKLTDYGTLWLTNTSLCLKPVREYPQSVINFQTNLEMPDNVVIDIEEMKLLDIFLNKDTALLNLSKDRNNLIYDNEEFTCYLRNYYDLMINIKKSFGTFE